MGGYCGAERDASMRAAREAFTAEGYVVEEPLQDASTRRQIAAGLIRKGGKWGRRNNADAAGGLWDRKHR